MAASLQTPSPFLPQEAAVSLRMHGGRAGCGAQFPRLPSLTADLPFNPEASSPEPGSRDIGRSYPLPSLCPLHLSFELRWPEHPCSEGREEEILKSQAEEDPSAKRIRQSVNGLTFRRVADKKQGVDDLFRQARRTSPPEHDHRGESRGCGLKGSMIGETERPPFTDRLPGSASVF